MRRPAAFLCLERWGELWVERTCGLILLMCVFTALEADTCALFAAHPIPCLHRWLLDPLILSQHPHDLRDVVLCLYFADDGEDVVWMLVSRLAVNAGVHGRKERSLLPQSLLHPAPFSLTHAQNEHSSHRETCRDGNRRTTRDGFVPMLIALVTRDVLRLVEGGNNELFACERGARGRRWIGGMEGEQCLKIGGGVRENMKIESVVC